MMQAQAFQTKMQAQYIPSQFANKNHDHYIQLQDYHPFEI